MTSDPKTIYDSTFYANRKHLGQLSARAVVPLTLEMVQDVNSVADIGCGTGAWLAVFRENGVSRIMGLDGGDVLDSGQLEIQPEEFSSINLELPLEVSERYDLCICLEVAEHLSERAAPILVKNLCDLSDVVLFSAAIPGQGGRHHINERWPSYWAAHFEAAGYRSFDVIRGRVWHDEHVAWWYRQNLLIFANSAGERRLTLKNGESGPTMPLDIAHPLYVKHSERHLGKIQLLESKLAALALRNEAKRDTILELKAKLSKSRKTNCAVQSSASWKLTRPLRWISRSIRGASEK